MVVQDPDHRLAVRRHRRYGRADRAPAAHHASRDWRPERGSGNLPAGARAASRSGAGPAGSSKHPAARDGAFALIPLPAKLGARAPLRRRLARVGALVAIAGLLAAGEGGSGQSGSAFAFLSVDGFSLPPPGTTGTAFLSSIPSSTAPGTVTSACVTLRNNLKNPTVTGPSAL